MFSVNSYQHDELWKRVAEIAEKLLIIAVYLLLYIRDYCQTLT